MKVSLLQQVLFLLSSNEDIIVLNHHKIFHIRYLYSIALLLLGSGNAIADINQVNVGEYSFRGNVLATPCQIATNSEKIPVDFGKIAVKELYENGKSKPLPFSIHLTNCSNAISKSLTVTFNGIENQNLPNYLAINDQSIASGIGIGLLNENNTPIQLNSPSIAQALVNNNMEIKFKAFVEAEPQALNNQTLNYGVFYSTAYYTLNYQ